MDIEDQIKLFLPKYLNSNDQEDLFEALKQFPNNLDLIYTSANLNNSIIYQGDGLESLPFIFLPDEKVQKENGMILSNTCDIDPSNYRPMKSRVIYCPIIQFQKYEKLVKNYFKNDDNLVIHLNGIKNQRITSFFYLPSYGDFPESIALLDRINNCDNGRFNPKVINNCRIFTLSNYGFYLFLIKISIHFTRIREGVNRNEL